MKKNYEKRINDKVKEIGELKRQLKDKEREIESLKKRQSREQQKNVQLSNTKIQRVGEGKNLTKSAPPSLRESKTNLIKTMYFTNIIVILDILLIVIFMLKVWICL